MASVFFLTVDRHARRARLLLSAEPVARRTRGGVGADRPRQDAEVDHGAGRLGDESTTSAKAGRRRAGHDDGAGHDDRLPRLFDPDPLRMHG